MTRRLIGLLITLALGFLVAPLGAIAQLPPKVPRVGILYVPAPLSLRYEEAFKHGLHTFGSVVGQHNAIEERSASQ
ncbi:MAG: hypothetical protein ACRERE_01585 [Candidatus Entotheonellia bacterium]